MSIGLGKYWAASDFDFLFFGSPWDYPQRFHRAASSVFCIYTFDITSTRLFSFPSFKVVYALFFPFYLPIHPSPFILQ